jgi:hypothetical protein
MKHILDQLNSCSLGLVLKNPKEYFKCEAQVHSPYVLKYKARKKKFK